MSLNLLVFLLGLFGVPLVLLIYAHHLRKRAPRVRAAFWGALTGHIIAGSLAVTIGMIPPAAWTSGETTRGVLGFWGMLVLPIVGAIVALAIRPRAEEDAA